MIIVQYVPVVLANKGCNLNQKSSDIIDFILCVQLILR